MHQCITVCIYMLYTLAMHAAANICTCKHGIAAPDGVYVHARACALVCVCRRHRSSHPIPVQLEFGVLVRFHRIVSS